MEGVRLFTEEELSRVTGKQPILVSSTDFAQLHDRQAVHNPETVDVISKDLKETLEGMVTHLFGDVEYVSVPIF